MFNRTTLLILLAAIGAGAGLLAAQRLWQPKDAHAPVLQAVMLYPQPRVLPDFSLNTSSGARLQREQLAGHWTLVFIGFTSCPDVCPLTLAALAKAQQAWQNLPEDTRPRVLFVSVDPERDTPERLGQYAHAFHPDTLAATAGLPVLDTLTRSLSLVFSKVPTGPEPGQYTIDHSAAMAVLDPEVRMAGVVPGNALNPAAIAADLLALQAATHTDAP